ncbi:uracil-DNA glycosylase family protein [Roseibium algae]|uniref:Uracil-DNA glycosylase family protein n=1 Tax=Roseibium algae TaxID=3123038 RepID=A0ABU8TIW5_9HYPH
MARTGETGEQLADLRADIAACRICVETPRKAALPHEPRPVVQLSQTARICICGQAPGTRVHQSGKPFTDPSGDRLRSWMGVEPEVFYDTARISIVPMGLCFPGLDAKGGDLPPRPECRAQWHDRIFAVMPQVELILVIGQYAQAYHLGGEKKKTLTETVANWSEYLGSERTPAILPMPHPSWRNNSWLKKNPWFEAELLPVLKQKIAQLV